VTVSARRTSKTEWRGGAQPGLPQAADGTAELWRVPAAVVVSLLALDGHIASWWLPYFGISTQAQRDAYQRAFAQTWKVLPTEGHDVVIDVQHMVVGAITLLMVGTTLAAALACPQGTLDPRSRACSSLAGKWSQTTRIPAVVVWLVTSFGRPAPDPGHGTA
jgi:hypothetical protein